MDLRSSVTMPSKKRPRNGLFSFRQRNWLDGYSCQTRYCYQLWHRMEPDVPVSASTISASTEDKHERLKCGVAEPHWLYKFLWCNTRTYFEETVKFSGSYGNAWSNHRHGSCCARIVWTFMPLMCNPLIFPESEQRLSFIITKNVLQMLSAGLESRCFLKSF